MCSGIFSCTGHKQVVFRESWSDLNQLMEADRRDDRSASQALSIADRLLSTVSGRRGTSETPGRFQNELTEATAKLYHAACELVDRPESPERWEKVYWHHNRSREIFSRGMAAMLRSCG